MVVVALLLSPFHSDFLLWKLEDNLALLSPGTSKHQQRHAFHFAACLYLGRKMAKYNKLRQFPLFIAEHIVPKAKKRHVMQQQRKIKEICLGRDAIGRSSSQSSTPVGREFKFDSCSSALTWDRDSEPWQALPWAWLLPTLNLQKKPLNLGGLGLDPDPKLLAAGNGSRTGSMSSHSTKNLPPIVSHCFYFLRPFLCRTRHLLMHTHSICSILPCFNFTLACPN